MATGRYVRCTTCSTDRFRTHCSAHTRSPTRPTVGAHRTRCGTVHSSSKQRSPRDCRAHCCPTQPNHSVSQPRGLHTCHSQRGRPSTAANAELRPLAACGRPRCRHAMQNAPSQGIDCVPKLAAANSAERARRRWSPRPRRHRERAASEPPHAPLMSRSRAVPSEPRPDHTAAPATIARCPINRPPGGPRFTMLRQSGGLTSEVLKP